MCTVILKINVTNTTSTLTGISCPVSTLQALSSFVSSFLFCFVCVLFRAIQEMEEFELLATFLQQVFLLFFVFSQCLVFGVCFASDLPHFVSSSLSTCCQSISANESVGCCFCACQECSGCVARFAFRARTTAQV